MLQLFKFDKIWRAENCKAKFLIKLFTKNIANVSIFLEKDNFHVNDYVVIYFIKNHFKLCDIAYFHGT